MKNYFYFGEKIKEYEVRVLNEREMRAGAGILFLFAMIAFFNACFLGNLYVIQIFIIVFLLDFIIRVLINPKYAPSLTLGRLFVSKQKPEYVGAPQKRFARAIGLVLAIIMFRSLIIQGAIGPVNVVICVLCLIFLFFESAFGICIGCKIYNMFNREKAKLCPGGVCEIVKKHPIQKTNRIQIAIVLVVLGGVVAFSFTGLLKPNTATMPQTNMMGEPIESSGGCASDCIFGK